MFAIAYRMLGSASDAENIVRDAWAQWSAPGHLGHDPAGELARIVTTLCMDRLESVRGQRDVYVGPWLPEPVLTASAFEGPSSAVGVLGPLDIAAQRETVSFGVLMLLERLTPPERAVYVLRDAFEYSHREVAELLGTTEGNARELHARARRHVEGPHLAPVEAERWHRLVDRFIAVVQNGDRAGLEALLAADAVARADGGGVVVAARRLLVGHEKVSRSLLGVVRRFGEGVEPFIAQVNGEPAVVALVGDSIAAVAFVHTDREHITGVDLVVNPGKLAFAQGQLARVAGDGTEGSQGSEV
jgi:RNA polymerase sigma-70 factor (ECF subfamily)